MNKADPSAWDVPRPALRLWLTLALGALGAALFPGTRKWLEYPMMFALAPTGVAWITAALAGALLLRLVEREKIRWRRPELRDLARAPAIALAAPLLLFAARRDPGDRPGSIRQALTRIAFAFFPYAIVGGLTLALFGGELSRSLRPLCSAWFAFSVWSWLGCVLLFLLSPWPEYPRRSRRVESKAERYVSYGGMIVFVAMVLLILRFAWRTLIDLAVSFPFIIIPLSACTLIFMVSPWPAFPPFPKLGDLPDERKLPAVGTILLLALVLLPFTTFALEPFLYVVSGKLFSNPFDRYRVGGGLIYFTYCALVLAPYVAIVRWLSNRRTSLGYWAFADATIALGIFMLSFLTISFLKLTHYILSKEINDDRIYGLIYCLVSYVATVGFLCWAIWPPREDEPVER